MRVFLQTLAAMNTRFSFLLPGVGEAEGQALRDEIAALLRNLEAVMSRFAPNAELAQINRTAADRQVDLSERLCAVLAECRAHWQRTGGAFDITLGAINDNWRGQPGPLRCGWDNVELDPKRRRIAFRTPGLRLDLGGIGKGIALRDIRRMLVARGIEQALLSFGDSSIVAIGTHPDGNDWPVGVCDAYNPSQSIRAFGLRDSALSTSGQGHRTHLVDPRTLEAAGAGRQITVACACPVDAEVLSTALITSPPGRRAKIFSQYPPADFAEFAWQGRGNEDAWSHAA
jgi:thiamine biosynthesis lipoprotein